MQTLVCFTCMVNNNHALQLFNSIDLDFSLKRELYFLIETKNCIHLYEKAFRRNMCTIYLGKKLSCMYIIDEAN